MQTQCNCCPGFTGISMYVGLLISPQGLYVADILHVLSRAATCHTGGQNIIESEKTLDKDALVENLEGGYKYESIVTQVRSEALTSAHRCVHSVARQFSSSLPFPLRGTCSRGATVTVTTASNRLPSLHISLNSATQKYPFCCIRAVSIFRRIL